MGGPGPGRLLAFGIPGAREVVLVVVVALVLYGRVGSRVLLSTRYGRVLPWWVRLLLPTTARPSPQPTPSPGPRGRETRRPTVSASAAKPARKPRGRLFWAVVLTAAAAMAALAATRVAMHNAVGSPH